MTGRGFVPSSKRTAQSCQAAALRLPSDEFETARWNVQIMELRDTVLDWLVSPETAYLIGAGCSCCAGKPLIAELTKRIVPDLAAPIQCIFGRLQGSQGRGATIEDLMNHLLKRRDILASLKNRDDEPISYEEIDEAIELMRHRIVQEMKDNWLPTDHHMRFLRRIANVDRRPRDIFTLNYDTVIEASLEAVRLAYVDGFVGAENAYFDPRMFHSSGGSTGLFRLFKMHGSINWARDRDGFIRRRPISVTEGTDDAIVVYPSEQKYVQTQYGAYDSDGVVSRKAQNRRYE